MALTPPHENTPGTAGGITLAFFAARMVGLVADELVNCNVDHLGPGRFDVQLPDLAPHGLPMNLNIQVYEDDVPDPTRVWAWSIALRSSDKAAYRIQFAYIDGTGTHLADPFMWTICNGAWSERSE